MQRAHKSRTYEKRRARCCRPPARNRSAFPRVSDTWERSYELVATSASLDVALHVSRCERLWDLIADYRIVDVEACLGINKVGDQEGKWIAASVPPALQC